MYSAMPLHAQFQTPLYAWAAPAHVVHSKQQRDIDQEDRPTEIAAS
jgi:hypothetical protein